MHPENHLHSNREDSMGGEGVYVDQVLSSAPWCFAFKLHACSRSRCYLIVCLLCISTMRQERPDRGTPSHHTFCVFPHAFFAVSHTTIHYVTTMHNVMLQHGRYDTVDILYSPGITRTGAPAAWIEPDDDQSNTDTDSSDDDDDDDGSGVGLPAPPPPPRTNAPPLPAQPASGGSSNKYKFSDV
jgi:hypothetical protein